MPLAVTVRPHVIESEPRAALFILLQQAKKIVQGEGFT